MHCIGDVNPSDSICRFGMCEYHAFLFFFFLLDVYCYDDGDVVYVLVKHVLLL